MTEVAAEDSLAEVKRRGGLRLRLRLRLRSWRIVIPCWTAFVSASNVHVTGCSNPAGTSYANPIDPMMGPSDSVTQQIRRLGCEGLTVGQATRL